jgi:hypothetical protein
MTSWVNGLTLSCCVKLAVTLARPLVITDKTHPFGQSWKRLARPIQSQVSSVAPTPCLALQPIGVGPVSRTSSSFWIPAEFCADCHKNVSECLRCNAAALIGPGPPNHDGECEVSRTLRVWMSLPLASNVGARETRATESYACSSGSALSFSCLR